MREMDATLKKLVGEMVVVDVASPFVYLGELVGGDTSFLELHFADVHDLRDTATTREEYVLAAGQHGITANRKRVFISRAEVVSPSRLADILC